MNIADQIKRGMALAFFASAYADLCEECDQPLTGEILDQLPPDIDPAALHAAETLMSGMRWANSEATGRQVDLTELYQMADDMDTEGADRQLTPELFGHYCAMQAMGHGVGLESFGYEVASLVVPDVAFGSYYLEGEYFTRVEADE